ncbi:hypothetical protein DENIS_4222 [Desulfonema ishimotonii]|uniref:Tetratricopeptide repeat protein n=1 Tax=Desulfonema ishimotonii TaxID=45657 RepID=A0A401G1W1_9BACT|nr:tetratricopeptide repeat protein [Desulfonema ishimotonii]GBC63228.1 hypothetical protein DENIS_4222 [Desulfonema ishimotonii]
MASDISKKIRLAIWLLLCILLAGFWLVKHYYAKQYDESRQLAALVEDGVWNALSDSDRIIEETTAALEKNPRDAEAYFRRGVAFSDNDDTDEALSDFNSALKAEPGFAEAWYYRGVVRSCMGEWEQAEADYRKSEELSPGMARAHYHRERIWFPESRFNYHQTPYDRILKIDPGRARECYLLGVRSFENKQYRPALRYFREAVEKNTLDAEACNFLGWILATCPDKALRNPRQALELAEKAVALRPFAYTYDTLATAHAATGDFEKAARIQKEGIALLKETSMNSATKARYLAEYTAHLSAYQSRKCFWEK